MPLFPPIPAKVTELTTSRTPKKDDSDFIVTNILREAGSPLTTRELQSEVRKVSSFCPSSSVVGLNLLRIAGVIKGKRSKENKGWIWWIED
jgi:hypothetical protein